MTKKYPNKLKPKGMVNYQTEKDTFGDQYIKYMYAQRKLKSVTEIIAL